MTIANQTTLIPVGKNVNNPKSNDDLFIRLIMIIFIMIWSNVYLQCMYELGRFLSECLSSISVFSQPL